MNSREIRKRAAEKHNLLRAIDHANQEDKIRDPEKYRRIRSGGRLRNRSVSAMVVASALSLGL